MHHLPQDQSDLHVRLHCADLSVRNLRSLRYTIFQLLKYHFNHSPAIHFLAIEFVPRLCQIRKWPGFPSYGFDLQPLETTKGQGHYIGRVLPGSPAQDAGLLYGDRIVEVNGINVENETIQKVAQRIDPASSETTLLVVDRVTDQLFKDQSTRISSAMPWLKKTATRPRVLKSPVRKKTPPRYNQPYYSNSHYLVSNHKETSAQSLPAAVLRQPTAKYGALPAKTTCAYCYNLITTEISYQPGRRAWIAVISLALIGCDAGCCLLPFLINDCKDIHHKCPECGLELGCFKR